MFLLVPVILSTGVWGVCLSARWDTTPLGAGTPPEQAPPRQQTPRHMVNERPVRILLECILVTFCRRSSRKLMFSQMSVSPRRRGVFLVDKLVVYILLEYFRVILYFWKFLIEVSCIVRKGTQNKFYWQSFVSLVARKSHLSGCFWLFAPKFWEVVGTYK